MCDLQIRAITNFQPNPYHNLNYDPKILLGNQQIMHHDSRAVTDSISESESNGI